MNYILTAAWHRKREVISKPLEAYRIRLSPLLTECWHNCRRLSKLTAPLLGERGCLYSQTTTIQASHFCLQAGLPVRKGQIIRFSRSISNAKNCGRTVINFTTSNSYMVQHYRSCLQHLGDYHSCGGKLQFVSPALQIQYRILAYPLYCSGRIYPAVV